MRVLVLAPHPYYIDRGTPIALDTMLRGFSLRGMATDALVYHEGKERTYPRVAVHRIRVPRWIRDVGPGFSFKKLLCDIALFWRAWTLVRSRQYEVIHACEESVYIALMFRLIYGTPYIYDMDSSLAQQMVEQIWLLKPLRGVLHWFERRAIRNAIAVAPVCNALAELARRAGAAHVEPFHDISQLKNPDAVPTGELRKRYDIRGPIVMYVGNFEPYQGVELLLKSFAIAVKQGTRATLMLAGGSPEHIAQAKARAAALEISEDAVFIGQWPASRLDELLAEADVLTSPRLRGINTPMKIFPYMHAGKPLLATDLETHNQILTPAIAQLAAPDPAKFAASMIELIEDADLRHTLGAAGRLFVEREHIFPAHQRRMEKLYGHVESVMDLPDEAPLKESGVKADGWSRVRHDEFQTSHRSRV